MIATIASQQVRSLRRQRTSMVVIGLFVAMTALAGAIGWSSSQTINRVYDEAVGLLAQSGKPAPTNPIGTKPTLSLLSNMTVYIPLVGALLALVLGHLSIADDRTNGIGRLLFSRPLARTDYLVGRMAGAALVLTTALGASLVVSVIALVVANGTLPSVDETGRLVLFYGLSLGYLLVFLIVGATAVLLTRKRSLALLVAMGVWLVVTFAVPQITSGLRPTASLNPLSEPASTTSAFFRVTSLARPLSLSEQYKLGSAGVLQTGPGAASSTFLHVLPVGLALLTLAALALVAVRKHDWSRSMAGE